MIIITEPKPENENHGTKKLLPKCPKRSRYFYEPTFKWLFGAGQNQFKVFTQRKAIYKRPEN